MDQTQIKKAKHTFRWMVERSKKKVKEDRGVGISFISQVEEKGKEMWGFVLPHLIYLEEKDKETNKGG